MYNFNANLRCKKKVLFNIDKYTQTSMGGAKWKEHFNQKIDNNKKSMGSWREWEQEQEEIY